MEFRSTLNRMGPLKAVLLLTLLAVLASVVLTWFMMTLTGHSMFRTAWLIAFVLPLLVVPVTGYKLIDLFFRLDRMEERFRRISMTDALTETLNRRSFLELAGTRFAHGKSAKQPVSVMVLDVDRFRQINNEHGTLAGDQVLRVVSRTCRGMVRRSDLLARYGSEALVFFLPDTERRNCEQFAEKLRLRLARTTVAHDGLLLRLTVSIGTSSSEEELYPDSLDDLITAAEAALSLATAGGRNRVEVVPAAAAMRPAPRPVASYPRDRVGYGGMIPQGEV